MGINRRQMLGGTAAWLVAGLAGAGKAIAEQSPAVAFLDKSQLIYLSPFLADGSESACHGEVWFVHHGGDIYVITRSDAWRTEAIRRGLRKTAVWIGEFGVWKRAKDQYRSAPYLEVQGGFEEDPTAQGKILERFGVKYADEWSSWGPRFRDGIADGSRVMLRYQVAA